MIKMEMLFSLQAAFFIFLISLYVCLLFLLPKPKQSKKISTTGFDNYPFLGNLPSFIKNRDRFLDWSTEVLAHHPTHTSLFMRPGIKGVVTANPINVEHMLKNNFDNYPKGQGFLNLLGDLMGRGIFNTDGDNWKHQRKTASYEFNTKSLRNFIMQSVVDEIETRLIPTLQKGARNGDVMDLQDVFQRFGFDNICKVAFNFDPGCLGGDPTSDSKFMLAFEDATTLSSGRFLYALPILLRIKKYLKIGSERKLLEAVAKVHQYVDNIIREGMQNRGGRKGEDLLTRFMDNEENYSPEFLREIVINIIFAGRDSTSSALASFVWVVSSRPDIEKNILSELQAIRRSRNSKRDTYIYTYTFDELREMHYLHAVVSETLRLYPPVSVDTKTAIDEDTLPDGTYVGKGWYITYHTWAMGRMETIWGKDAHEFKPERWLEDGICKQESPFRFPVFHAGPRICLGKEMAYIQMKSVAASFVERFQVDVVNRKETPDHLLSLTIKMRTGLQVKIKERTSSTTA